MSIFNNAGREITQAKLGGFQPPNLLACVFRGGKNGDMKRKILEFAAAVGSSIHVRGPNLGISKP